MQPAVRQAISTMQERYFEPLTLNDIATEVFVSPFHFSRIFAKEVGVSPGRYLTAVRMFEVKRLLLTSSLTVSEIVCSVGYSSVGTFTSRFTRAVGRTPSQYRDAEVRDLLMAIAPHYRRLPAPDAMHRAVQRRGCTARGGNSITTSIEMPPGTKPGNVLVAAFAERVPQCGPVAFAGVASPQSSKIELPDVPAGTWNVVAAAECGSDDSATPSILWGTARRPITVGLGGAASAHVRMQSPRSTDIPIAFTLASCRSSSSNRHAMGDSRDLHLVA
ncbi:helix-turn-helix transcriptional regulator [Plantactinospora soyae]|nr:AraC family transcriptional regulator [Plantactinospora soyae]